jgi:hypothetical protein
MTTYLPAHRCRERQLSRPSGVTEGSWLDGATRIAGYVTRESTAKLNASDDAVPMTGKRAPLPCETHGVGRHAVTPPVPVAVELTDPFSPVAASVDTRGLADELARALNTRFDYGDIQKALSFAVEPDSHGKTRSIAAEIEKSPKPHLVLAKTSYEASKVSAIHPPLPS